MTETRLRNYSRLSLLSAGSALLATWVLLFGYFWHFERDETLDNLIVQTRLVSANITAALVFEDVRTATEIIATLEDAPDVLEATLYRRNGQALAHYQRRGTKSRLGQQAPALGHQFSLTELTVTLPVTLERQTVGAITTRITLRTFYQLALWFATGMFGITIVSVVIAHQTGRRLRLRMEASELEFERMALRDAVTGLSNRHAFELALGQTLSRHLRDGGSSALLYIDLDGFKLINDTHGHAIGDKLLATISQRLRDALRGADILARIGGDEFGIILTNTASPDDAARVAENLVRLAAQPVDANGTPVYVGFSIGIGMLPMDGDTVESALHNADTAMYHAKKIGKGRYQFFSANIDSSPLLRQRVETDLRVALRSGELYVVYQPQRFTRSGRIAGLEALVRWRHGERGIVSPSDFIPIAEETGLIGDIGRTVLDLVCRDIVELRGAGRVVPPVAINVSIHQLDDRFVADTFATLDRYGLKPEAIEIELADGALAAQIDRYAEVLSQIAAAGIRLVLDDFNGDGSLLATAGMKPFSRIKIDMSLIRTLPENADALVRVHQIIGAGHASGLRLVAEGVESAIQAETLGSAGCDVLQGYHLGLPVRKQEIMLFLEQP